MENQYCIYARCSANSRSLESSMENQIENLEKLAEKNGIDLVCLFMDCDGSYKDLKRMLKMIGRGKINGVLIKNISKLGRNSRILNTIYEAYEKGNLKEIRTSYVSYKKGPYKGALLATLTSTRDSKLGELNRETLKNSVGTGNYSFSAA